MEKVLFEVTEDHLETGMRGYPVGYCTTSYVDPIKGLFYKGRPIAELCKKEPEQVIYLLYHGEEGSETDVTRFAEELKKRGRCSQAVIKHILSLPGSGDPMQLFASAILISGMVEGGKRDYREDALHLIAKIPHLAATVINHHAGWGETPPPDRKMGYMENFARMLRAPQGNEKQLAEIFRLFNVMHYDHGGGNLSAFVGKAVASGLEDLYGSVASSMCALAGPRHGRANRDCLEFVRSILDELGEAPSSRELEELIRKRMEEKKLIYGFGHTVLRAEDARATLFYETALAQFPAHPLVKIALSLRGIVPDILKELSRITSPYPNVDAISGTVLVASGFPHPEYFTVLFGMARVVGISLQIIYERCEARGGKGTPIVRPKYLYTGKKAEN